MSKNQRKQIQKDTYDGLTGSYVTLQKVNTRIIREDSGPSVGYRVRANTNKGFLRQREHRGDDVVLSQETDM